MKTINKDLLAYLNGERNAVKGEFILSRERLRNAELIFVSVPEVQDPLYALFHARKRGGLYRVHGAGVDAGEEEVARAEVRHPRGTGGIPSYVMLMLPELERAELSVEAAGLLLKLAGHLEWNTGMVIERRGGRPMTREGIAREMGIGMVKVKRLLAELSEIGAIRYEPSRRAYFVASRFMRKGAFR